MLLLLPLESHQGTASSSDAINRLRSRAADRWSDAIGDAAGGAVDVGDILVADLAVFCRAVADRALIAGLADDDVRTSDVYDTLSRVLTAMLAST